MIILSRLCAAALIAVLAVLVGENERLLRCWALYRLAHHPTGPLFAHTLQHVVPQRHASSLMRLARKVKAVGRQVAAVGHTFRGKWEVRVDKERLVDNLHDIYTSYTITK